MKKEVKNEIYRIVKDAFNDINEKNILEIQTEISTNLKERVVKKYSIKKSSVEEKKNTLLKKYLPSRNEKIKNKIIKEHDLIKKLGSLDYVEIFLQKEGAKFFKQDFDLDKEIAVFEEFLKTEQRGSVAKELIKEIMQNAYQYAPARKIKRKIIYHMGPTNSGKTYNAIQALRKANIGCYLAPLRLLAVEKFDELSENKVTALVTGEESVKPEDYTHTSSTIEMANYNKVYDVAVIDEIQMISDIKRGWAWTKALLNLQANELHICGDASCLDLVKRIVKITGDELVENVYERKTKLTLQDKVISERDLQKGDALIVFSRKEALLRKEELENQGWKVSVIYGMLSPEVRKKQATLFRDGETDIVISTDAIGMGLNLPIKRVVFTTVFKYFNKQEHVITVSEIKQIAGRAGRFNLYPEGFVALLDQAYSHKWNYKEFDAEDIAYENRYMLKRIRHALNTDLSQQTQAITGPDLDVLKLLNDKLSQENYEEMTVLEFFYFFNKISPETLFKKANIEDIIEQTELIVYTLKHESYDVEKLFKYAIAPVLLRNEEHLKEFVRLFSNYFNDLPSHQPEYMEMKDLHYLESSLKKIELYQWLANQCKELFIYEEEQIKDMKNDLVNKINEILIES